MHKKTVHELEPANWKENEAQKCTMIGQFVKWDCSSCLTFTVAGSNIGGPQMQGVGEKWLSNTILG